ncbi:MAG: extracellular solute-binding protein [Anaerolineales bacterium]|nr:extracellular solute-binding protein [Anaerolineales bacterium]
MLKKTFIFLSGLLVLSLMLVACGGGEEEATQEPVPSECFMNVEEGATIVFSGWGDETEQQIYHDSIERFAEVCPAVTVDYQPIPADFQTKLKASMAGGTAADVFYVDDQLMTAFGPTGQILPLDDFMAEAGTGRGDFLPALLSIFTLEGDTYALPKDWGTLGLVYLPAAFESAGIDEPTADWTWDDLKAAAEAITATGEYAGFCQNADWARFAPWAFGNGGAYASEDFTTALAASDAVFEAAEYVAAMYADGSLVSAADVGAGWCGEAIGKELAGMTYEGGWMVNYMRNDFPDVNWVAQELPTGPEGKADVIFTNGIGVNAATKYPKAAAAFTIFVTGADNQGEIVKTGFAYSTHPEQLDDVVDPNDAAIAKGGSFDLTRVAYWGPNTGKVNDAVSQALERVYLGDQTVEESFAQAQEEAAEFLTGEGAEVGTITDTACPLSDLEEGAIIVFSGWGDETEQQIYHDSIERFAEVCPDVTVDYQPIPADFQTKLKASMAGGTAADVFYVDDQLMTAFGPTGQILPLDDFMAEAGTGRGDFLPALLSIFTLEGDTYALPKDWGTLGLVYLPAAFESAGIDEPTADWTWDDLKAAAEAITATGEYAGFCQNADWARFAPWAFGNGGAYASEDFTTALAASDAVFEAAEYVAAMYADGSLVSAADVGAGWCGEAIGKELAGMTYEGGWMVNYMRNDFPDVNWVAQELPTGPEGKADVIFTNGIGVNAATKYPRAAAAFAIFVTGADNQGEIVKTGFAYSTHPEQLDLVIDPNDAAIAKGGGFDLTRVAYWGPNTGKVNDAISQALERIYLGDQSIEEAFSQANEEIQGYLDEVQ